MDKHLCRAAAVSVCAALLLSGCGQPQTVPPEPSPSPFVTENTPSPERDLSPLRLEAEDAPHTGEVSLESDGYSGGGYCQLQQGSSISFTADAPQAGDYRLTIRYACGAGDADYTLEMGGVTQGLTLPHTAGDAGEQYDRWNSWMSESLELMLNEGENVLTMAGGFRIALIDYITLEPIFTPLIASFSFLRKDNPALPGDIACQIRDTGRIDAIVPSGTDLSALVPTFKTMGELTFAGKPLVSGVTTAGFGGNPILTAAFGAETQTYTLDIRETTDTKLPSLLILLDSGNPSGKENLLTGFDKEMRVRSTFSLTLGKENSVFDAEPPLLTVDGAEGEVNLRGNSTLGSPKKSYRLRFADEQALLDMPANRHWVLLANPTDKSLLRPVIGFKLSRVFDQIEYTPRMRGVHLYIDGVYSGVYLLGEHIRESKERVDITDAEEDRQPFEIGYLLQFNRRAEYETPEISKIQISVPTRSGKDQTWVEIMEPDGDVMDNDRKDYIQNHLAVFFGALQEDYINGFQTRSYTDYIDIGSFVDWYLCEEIMKTLDSNGYASVYFYKESEQDGGLLRMGPVWDFDISSGNSNYWMDNENPQDLWTRNYLWFDLLLEDPEFARLVRDRFEQKLPEATEAVTGYLDAAYTYYSAAAADNYARWDVLSRYDWPQPRILHTYDAYVAHLRDWFRDRLGWLTEADRW
ncbi:MAG: CotH kinase family protein [Oscillospiraceae bacterium]|jgi:hypothetical protein|nr:CotH kinase family protein [Oscillospiraceae bacterium]